MIISHCHQPCTLFMSAMSSFFGDANISYVRVSHAIYLRVVMQAPATSVSTIPHLRVHAGISHVTSAWSCEYHPYPYQLCHLCLVMQVIVMSISAMSPSCGHTDISHVRVSHIVLAWSCSYQPCPYQLGHLCVVMQIYAMPMSGLTFEWSCRYRPWPYQLCHTCVVMQVSAMSLSAISPLRGHAGISYVRSSHVIFAW